MLVLGADQRGPERGPDRAREPRLAPFLSAPVLNRGYGEKIAFVGP
ncbi:MAG: hypothetical protein AVDCRST_MAG02-4279 [uncultured Rubrobacteraceae bacterium]|uniref:Uncharacterized protein n=1 Tax=uncultured Rubrobacteraceae bacterium TaxID=349277 RepID=A0A6J4RH31_9ACTN|nr:MAG: hypothetical protein AVDCRST_MAG02-4279 [uncultured Rubrobacteraceae bacterium]